MTSFADHVIALAVVAIMGLAIQRGNTCAVAAIDEAVHLRRFHIIWSIFDVVVIVAGLYAALHLAGLLTLAPKHALVSWHTIVGGVLLGLGACVNGACTIGALARIGSGDLAFLATPVGVFLGCDATSHFANNLLPQVEQNTAATNDVALGVLVACLLIVGVRLWRGAPEFRRGVKVESIVRHTWNPRVANTVIGLSFIVLALVAGPWSYTDWLYRLARGDASGSGFLAWLSIVLFIGAVVGGRLMGKWSIIDVRLSSVIRCVVGGALMGIGLCLVPGANDGLTLEQVPLLIPSAAVAMLGLFATVIAVVWVAGKRSIVVSASRRDQNRARGTVAAGR